MRILVVADFYRHGTARVIDDRAAELARRGHEVVLLAGAEPSRLDQDALAARAQGLDPELVPYVPGERGVRSFFALARSYRAAFEKRASRRPFDAILFNQPLSAWALLRSPRARASATLYSFHSPWGAEWSIQRGPGPKAAVASRLRAWIEAGARRWIEERAVGRCVRVTLLSHFMRALLASEHPRLPSTRVTRIPGGVNLERFHPPAEEARRSRRTALGVGPEEILLCTVRRLVPRMGVDHLIQAFALLSRRDPRLRLAIGGAGPEEGSLRRECERAGLQGRTRFLGFVPEEELAGLYGAADIFVLPTVRLEGFGLVTVEALACGTPVVGTPVGATPEILRPIDPRLLAFEAAPEALARAIEGIASLAEPERRAIGARAAQRVRELYDGVKVGDALESLLGLLMEERSGGVRPDRFPPPEPGAGPRARRYSRDLESAVK